MFSIKLLDVKTGNVERQLAKNIPKIDLIVEIKSMALSFIKLEIIEQHDSEGGFYKGYLNNNERNGMGTYEYPANDKYKRDKYEGDWANGKKHGYGKLCYSNGDYYEGHWKDDKMDGKGVYYCSEENYRSEGTWTNGIRTDKNKKRHVTFMPEQLSVNMRGLSSFDRNGIIGWGIYFNRSFFQLGFDVLLCSDYCSYDNGDIFEGNGIDTYESGSYYCDEVSKALSEDFYEIEYDEEGEYIHPIVQLAVSPGLNFRYFSIECGLGTFINKNVKTVEQGTTLEINKSIGPLFFVRPTITGYISFGDSGGLSVSGGYNIVPKAKFLNAFMFSIGFFWIL